VLRTEALTIRFGGLVALNSVNFEIRRGEISRRHRAQRRRQEHVLQLPHRRAASDLGPHRVQRRGLTGLPSDRISQKGIARSYQDHQYPANATVLENVRIAAQSRRHGWNMFRHYSAFRDIIDKADAVLESVGLAAKADELASNLSHGEQRNLEIASRSRPSRSCCVSTSRPPG